MFHISCPHIQMDLMLKLNTRRSDFLQTFTKSSDSDWADKSHSDIVSVLLAQSDRFNEIKVVLQKSHTCG